MSPQTSRRFRGSLNIISLIKTTMTQSNSTVSDKNNIKFQPPNLMCPKLKTEHLDISISVHRVFTITEHRPQPSSSPETSYMKCLSGKSESGVPLALSLLQRRKIVRRLTLPKLSVNSNSSLI